ncbi:MAG: SRPBCC family protein [Formivibrio sp.]|nr:SRPBCC family protein [Formivibrio sp.]
MHYEHLVAVNDLTNPLTTVITRSQLWQGLLLKAESPQLFHPHIESVTILERTATLIRREVNFGNMLVREHIHLQEALSLHHDTEPGKNHAGGKLLVQIEEPNADNLLVRFGYEIPDPTDPEATKLIGYLQEMWRQMDVDSIRKIRELAETGHLDMKQQ